MNRQQKIFVMLMAACMAFTGISTISMASAAEVQPQEKVVCQQEIFWVENIEELVEYRKKCGDFKHKIKSNSVHQKDAVAFFSSCCCLSAVRRRLLRGVALI